jgi:hypothetical protein
VDGKLWSAIRGMDRTGVDDPEAEQTIIRTEQTDAALNPAAVQVMAQLAQVLQTLGYQNAQQAAAAVGAGGPPGGGGPPPDQGQAQADLAAQAGAAGGQVGSGEQPIPGQEAMPGNTPEGQAAGNGPMTEPGAAGGGPEVAPGGQVLAQTMVKGGAASNRLLFQQKVGGQGTGGA